MTGHHTLLEPRFLAAVGVLGLGSSIGLALLLAAQFPLVGLLLSLASVAGAIWIYFSEFYEVYRALIAKRAHTGAHIAELLLTFTLAIVITTLSLSLYFSPPSTDNPSVRSRLEFDTLTPQKDSDSANTYFNVQLTNVGILATQRGSTMLSGLLSDHLLSEDEVHQEMDKIADVIKRVPQKDRKAEIPPSQAAIITIPDHLNIAQALEVTDDDLAKITSGKKLLYVFLVAEYEDETPRAKNWRFEYCGFFTLTFAYWHNCPAWPSRVYQLPPHS